MSKNDTSKSEPKARILDNVIRNIIRIGQNPDKEDQYKGFASYLIESCMQNGSLWFARQTLNNEPDKGEIMLNGAGLLLSYQEEKGHLKFRLYGDQINGYTGSVNELYAWLNKEHLFLEQW
jgi:hypothetical protein